MAAGYDGVITRDVDGKLGAEVVAFNPNQVKSTDSENFDTGDDRFGKSQGGALDLARAMMARKRADGTPPSPTKFMPGVARAVHAAGGPVLFSKAAKLAADLPQEVGTPEQMVAMLRKRGASEAELKNAGMPAGPKVHRDMLSQHYFDKTPKIKHTIFRDPEDHDDPYDDGVYPETRYNEYVAGAGGDNYREHLLQLQRGAPPEAEDIMKQRLDARKGMKEAIANGQGEDAINVHQDRLRELDAKNDALSKAHGLNAYKSGHWDQPDVVAHFRTTDRPGKTLNVEEVQSDWGQEGRKQGFRDPEETKKAAVDESMADLLKRNKAIDLDDAAIRLKAHKENAHKVLDRLFKEGHEPEAINTHPDMVEAMAKLGLAEARHDELHEAHEKAKAAKGEASGKLQDIVGKNQPPAGPYVGNTQGWLDLALKHIMSHAAKNGYDRVSFNPGEANADMFGLEKKISGIKYHPENGYLDVAEPGLGWKMILNNGATDDKVREHIGKELTDKLLAQPQDDFGYHKLIGPEMKVGGEGMKGFYDNILPKAALKMARVHDPDIQPEPYDLGGGYKAFSIPVTDKLREGFSQPQPAFADGGRVTDNFKKWFGKSHIIDDEGKPMVVHHFTYNDFNKFDRLWAANHFKRDPEGVDTVGHWFTDNPKARYVNPDWGGKRVDAHLSIKNPLYIDDEAGEEGFVQLQKMVQAAGGSTNFRKALKERGHDGVILNGTHLDGVKQNAIIALEPEQIKHATKNNGDYSPDDPDITKSYGGAV